MFIFKDKTSDEMGLKCVQYTLRKRAGRKWNKYEIPGKPEPLIEMENTFSPVTVAVECDIMNETSLDDIFSWLNGKGILIDERYPDKYRIAQAPDEIDTVAVNDEIRTITIPFLCSAFMYSVENEPFKIPGYGGYPLAVQGTYYSEPQFIVKLHPSGNSNFTLTVNGTDFTIDLLPEDENHNIVIDSEKRLAYYEDTKEIILERTSGKFPLLDNENLNPIDWHPYIAETVHVVKNERWL